MLRNWEKERDARVQWIRTVIGKTDADPGFGIVYGNSGGKDCTLAGILCRCATENTLGVIMPCQSSRNFGIDRDHALLVAQKYDIPTIQVDLSEIKSAFVDVLNSVLETMQLSEESIQKGKMNVNPRLRMTTLYTIAQSRGALVCGTGNRSEAAMGYFTKWGDGAFDFNPIADLTVTEIFDFLRFLGAPDVIITKAPSAGLFEGQTDEGEMGIKYAEIDEFLLHGTGTPANVAKIKSVMKKTEHKRCLPLTYNG